MKMIPHFTTRCVSVYDMGDGWMMEIFNDSAEWYAEAWIYRKDYGQKMLMFGCNYNQKTCSSLFEFHCMAVENFDDYTDIYDEEVL